MAGGRPPQEQVNGSDALELGNSPFVGDVSGVQCGFRLDQNDVDFFLSYGEMFHSARHDHKFALVHYRFAITEPHAQSAFDDQEQLIFIFMMMPDEFTFQLYGFDVAVVYLPMTRGLQ
jgi:hypothetical protein